MSHRHEPLPQPLASPERLRLDNGLALALLSRPGIGKAAISLRVAAGSHDEPLDHPGLAHFLEHLLFLGSRDYAVEQSLMAFVQASGGQLNASTQARHTDYFCEVPADRLAGALARLVDMLANPLLDLAAQRREREVVHAEFVARGQDADTLVTAALGQALPLGHRCGAFVAGNRDTLEVDSDAFQLALREFHRRFYQAARISLVLVGPQSLEELQGLAELHAGRLPSLPGSAPVPLAPLLPLRRRQLRMTLPGPASLQLGFALELPATQGAAALDYLLTWLADESPGGLLASLREAGLCSGLQVRVPYQHADQALLLLAFSDVETSVPSRATIAAAVRDWLGFFAGQEDCAPLRDSYRAMLHWRSHSLEPLALARYWQDCLGSGRDPVQGLTRAGQDALSGLLAQLQSSECMIGLFASPVEVARWPCAGFALRMVPEESIEAPARSWNWRMPALNPFLAPAQAERAVSEAEARLRWLDLPDAGGGAGQGVFFARCCLAATPEPGRLLALVQAHLGELRAHAAQVGVGLQLSVEGGELQVALRGPAALVPRVLERLLGRLQEPLVRGPLPEALVGELPIRQLLRRLGELFAPPPNEHSQQPQALLRPTAWEGLGVGLARADRARIERLFWRISPLAPADPPGNSQAGRYWRDAGIQVDDTTLLLFCPHARGDALSEAGWRLLAQFYQGAFYRRLRSELQLGYALFCGYRQVCGRGGMLFAVQSPHASPAQVLGHIEAFLQVQGERLATLPDDELASVIAEQGRQLQARATGPVESAELHWQQHLAGLPATHGAALQAALAEFDRPRLLRLHQALCSAQGGWHVLANSGPPDDSWSASS